MSYLLSFALALPLAALPLAALSRGLGDASPPGTAAAGIATGALWAVRIAE